MLSAVMGTYPSFSNVSSRAPGSASRRQLARPDYIDTSAGDGGFVPDDVEENYYQGEYPVPGEEYDYYYEDTEYGSEGDDAPW